MNNAIDLINFSAAVTGLVIVLLVLGTIVYTKVFEDIRKHMEWKLSRAT